MDKIKDKARREILAKADFCRTFLHVQGFISEEENKKVFQRMKKWQDRYKVQLTEAQILSVDITYHDNAKEQ